MVGRRNGARRRRVWLPAVAAASALALGLATPTAASASDDEPRLVVMTRNLYLGSSLVPALTATDTASFLGAVARIYGTAQFTSFPARAQAVADEVAVHRPDLVGLQEVTRWETSGPGVPPTQDFLEVLVAALQARGLDYDVAAVASNADIGPVPLVQPCGSATVGACLVTLKDRDVVLVKADRKGLRWGNPRTGAYLAQQTFTPPVPGADPVSFKRGWASVDGRVDGVRFHFANTHLETEDFPGVQQAQAAEFLAGPALGRGADIATGRLQLRCRRQHDDVVRPAHPALPRRLAGQPRRPGPDLLPERDPDEPDVAAAVADRPRAGPQRGEGRVREGDRRDPVPGDATAVAVRPRGRRRDAAARRLTGHVAAGAGAVAGFSQTDTCCRLSWMNGSPRQPAQRSRSLIPASSAIRSSSAGQT